MLVIAITAVGFYILQAQSEKEPVKIYKAAPPEGVANSQPKPPPPGQTYETGHWHGDEWHAEPHEPVVEVSDESVEDYRDLELETYEASLAHYTAEERTQYDNVLRGEIVRHREKYPNCQEHEAVFEDADRVARWYVEYKNWGEELEESRSEWKTVMYENDELYENLRSTCVQKNASSMLLI